MFIKGANLSAADIHFKLSNLIIAAKIEDIVIKEK
jgi:hypothetical protein